MGRRGDDSTDVTAILMREMGRKRKTKCCCVLSGPQVPQM